MKTKSLLPCLGFCIILSTPAFSQVKIGSNPATISANSNLEVEATNGKKVLVRKNDGSVVIENTASGAATDSILTIDTAGNVRRRTQDAIQSPPYLKITGTINVPLPQNGVMVVTGLAEAFGKDITYDPATGEMTITKPGIYFCSAYTRGLNAPDATRNDNCIGVYINRDLQDQQACARSSSRNGASATNAALHRLNAGDKVDIRIIYGAANATNPSMNIAIAVSLYKISEL